MTQAAIHIGQAMIGADNPVYIVAELSANHHQQYEEAVKLMKAAKEAGADAVKLQTYGPDSLTIQSNEPYFRITGGTPWDGMTLYELYAQTCMPLEWHSKLKQVADDLDLGFFSTPYDKDTVDFLTELGVPAFKVASFEIVDIPLIEYIASKHKPIIISTGMASLDEIDEAVDAARKAGASQIALLKCTSAYPALPEEMNLRTIPSLVEAFRVPVGLSDHTLEITIPVLAVAMGACIVEKHLTLSRGAPGPDSAFSLEPEEFRVMVDAIRTAERALGDVQFVPAEHEASSLSFRRSLFVVRDVAKGEVLSEDNIRSIRPADGLHPRYLPQVVGRQAARDIRRGTPLSWDLIS